MFVHVRLVVDFLLLDRGVQFRQMKRLLFIVHFGFPHFFFSAAAVALCCLTFDRLSVDTVFLHRDFIELQQFDISSFVRLDGSGDKADSGILSAQEVSEYQRQIDVKDDQIRHLNRQLTDTQSEVTKLTNLLRK